MKVIIAGSRTCIECAKVAEAVQASEFLVSEVVSGGCQGVDKLGERWAELNFIPTKIFKADWKKFGPAAGPIRNAAMAHYAEALVALWDGESKGTASMIREAQKRNLKIHIHTLN